MKPTVFICIVLSSNYTNVFLGGNFKKRFNRFNTYIMKVTNKQQQYISDAIDFVDFISTTFIDISTQYLMNFSDLDNKYYRNYTREIEVFMDDEFNELKNRLMYTKITSNDAEQLASLLQKSKEKISFFKQALVEKFKSDNRKLQQYNNTPMFIDQHMEDLHNTYTYGVSIKESYIPNETLFGDTILSFDVDLLPESDGAISTYCTQEHVDLTCLSSSPSSSETDLLNQSIYCEQETADNLWSMNFDDGCFE